MKKMILPVLALLLVTGCASQAQKDEVALLKEIHKAERKINSGKVDVLIGSAIVTNGQLKIAAGKKAYAKSVQLLQDSLSEKTAAP